MAESELSVKWNDREVTNRAGRAVVIGVAIAVGTVMFMAGLLWMAVVWLVFLVTLPLVILADLTLKACGRRGFVTWGAVFKVEVNRSGWTEAR